MSGDTVFIVVGVATLILMAVALACSVHMRYKMEVFTTETLEAINNSIAANRMFSAACITQLEANVVTSLQDVDISLMRVQRVLQENRTLT